MKRCCRILIAVCAAWVLSSPICSIQNAYAEENKELQAALEEQLPRLNEYIEDHPEEINGYSTRGDIRFFLGDFPRAVEDYSKMVELDESRDASHWRRGIAYFYAGRYEDAAAQFGRYHSFDNVDRENGIWRYLSMYRAQGPEKARQELLKYEKDDREPFGDVYRLFAGEITGSKILERIQQAEIDDSEREKRLFYAELYIGLNELVEGRKGSAKTHLEQAVATSWPRKAGYGPNYMWHVARLQLDSLTSLKDGQE
ncbi:MAG: hypothetical protein KDA80_03910 [Planctomycetaceae bacterium]|nr:hypothetical protein [Planctomycetaceae bacterium]